MEEYTMKKIITWAKNTYDLDMDEKTIRAKIVRMLQDHNAYDKAPTDVIDGKNQRVFPWTVAHKIVNIWGRSYFERRAGEKYWRAQEINEEEYKALQKYDQEAENPYPYRFNEIKRDFMLECLFKKFFEFDEDALYNDLLIRQERGEEVSAMEVEAIDNLRSFDSMKKAYVKEKL